MMINKIKNYIKKNTGILIRLDDIAENMNWDLMEKSELLFNKYDIKPVLGVIPNNQDKELLAFPKKNNFWEFGKVKAGKFQCTDRTMFLILPLIIKIIFLMEVCLNFLVIVLMFNFQKLKMD